MVDWDRANGRGATGRSPRWYLFSGLVVLVAAIAAFGSGLLALGAIVLVLAPLNAYAGWQSYHGQKVWGYRRWRE